MNMLRESFKKVRVETHLHQELRVELDVYTWAQG